MKVLIIGGTGFIGRHLIPELKDFCEIILLHRGNNTNISIEPYHSIISDRRQLPHLKNVIKAERPEVVIDLIPYFAQDAWDVISTFGQISKKVIAISSGDVYRTYEIFKNNLRSISESPSSEDSELRQKMFPYRNMDKKSYLLENYDKILVENILQNQDEFNTTILRLGAVYGAFDSQRKLKDYLLPMLKNEDEIFIHEEKAMWKWTRVFVKDVAKSIRLVLENEENSRDEIFNVGEKESLSQLELIRKLKELTNWSGTIRVSEQPTGENLNYKQHLLLDTKKIREILSYDEDYTFEDGLKEAINSEQRLL